MKKVAPCIIVILLFSILCLTLIPQNVSSKPQDIKILSYSYYIDNLDYLAIVGEIQNTGTSTIKRAVLTVTVYGEDGTVQGGDTRPAWLSYMVPQQKSPFMIDIPQPLDYPDWYSAGVSKIVLSVQEAAEVDSYLYSDFKITVSYAGVSTNAADKGAYWVDGVIQNVGVKVASKLAVAAVFYNSSGTVVAIGRTDYLVPNTVVPSENVQFKVGAFDTIQTEEPESRRITSYALFVQADSPLIDGKAPVATPVTGDSLGSQQPGGSLGSQPSGGSNQLSNNNFLYILIVVAVVVTVIVALLVSRNKGRSVKVEVVHNKLGKKSKKMIFNESSPYELFMCIVES